MSFCYTRDGPIRELVDRLIAPHYVGSPASRPEELFDAAAWSNNAILARASGIARSRSSTSRPGTSPRSAPASRSRRSSAADSGASSATAIVGYPPTMPLRGARRAGARGCSTRAGAASSCRSPRRGRTTLERLATVRALGEELLARTRPQLDLQATRGRDRVHPHARARSASAGSRTSCRPVTRSDVAAVRRGGRRADRDGRRAGRRLPPGGAAAPRRRRRRADRRARRTAGSPGCCACSTSSDRSGSRAHMFPHVHSRLLSGLGIEGVPIEWGILGNGVDQVSDTFTRPVRRRRLDGAPAGRSRIRHDASTPTGCARAARRPRRTDRRPMTETQPRHLSTGFSHVGIQVADLERSIALLRRSPRPRARHPLGPRPGVHPGARRLPRRRAARRRLPAARARTRSSRSSSTGTSRRHPIDPGDGEPGHGALLLSTCTTSTRSTSACSRPASGSSRRSRARTSGRTRAGRRST